jgi:ADP-ribosyl-[dinitrogen reductase] hydrolase
MDAFDCAQINEWTDGWRVLLAKAAPSQTNTMIDKESVVGALLGSAIGDALGMPVEGLSHANVRAYYRGIKEYRDDEQRKDLVAGQWTDDTQLSFALAEIMAKDGNPANWPDRFLARLGELLPEARRWGPTTRAAIGADGARGRGDPTNGAAARATVLGLWMALRGVEASDALDVVAAVSRATHHHPISLVAAACHARAIRFAAEADVESFERAAFWSALLETAIRAEEAFDEPAGAISGRLRTLEPHLDEWPLDLLDVCDGASLYADESWPFAAAMFARAPQLVEATLLSTINCGGDADTTGAFTGALLGALHGVSAFPGEWLTHLERSDALRMAAEAFYESFAQN